MIANHIDNVNIKKGLVVGMDGDDPVVIATGQPVPHYATGAPCALVWHYVPGDSQEHTHAVEVGVKVERLDKDVPLPDHQGNKGCRISAESRNAARAQLLRIAALQANLTS